jgi:hypothetical protein
MPRIVFWSRLLLRICLGLIAFLVTAQDEPLVRKVSGQVVDESGAPVAGAAVLFPEGIGPGGQSTDAMGRFSLRTTEKALLIGKFGYRSEFLPTANAEDRRIVLRKVGPRPMRECRGIVAKLETANTGKLWFPVGEEFERGENQPDIDYSMRLYSLKIGRQRKWIRHGAGAMWSFGIPSGSDVHRSVSYSESHYRVGAYYVTDARGEYADGKRWRFVGMIGESADYSDMEPEIADKLDRVLDGVCMFGPR